MRKKIRDYRRELAELDEQRRPWVDYWKEIRDYLLPGKGRFPGDAHDGGRRNNRKIIDSRPTKNLRNLAAIMQGGLTSPARPWFRLGLADQDVMEWKPAREWLSIAEKRLYRALSHSNFYDAMHSIYTELAAFGTACLYVEEDWERYIRCRVLTIGEYFAGLDGRSRVDLVYRRFQMTARQMVNKWPDTVSDSVKQTELTRPHTRFEVVHAVQARRDLSSGKLDSGNMPFESVYFEPAGEDFLHVGGYREFPYMIPRWDASGADVYGRSPGMDCLPDVKMLMEISKCLLKGVHKELDPPVIIPPTFKQRLDLTPGGKNYGDVQKEFVRPVYQVKPNLEAAQNLKNDVLSSIKEGFFNDLFAFLMNRPGVTATEVAERHEEKMLMLGPVIERQQAELLDPFIERSFGIMLRSGLIPSPPTPVSEAGMKIEYISLLAQAQKLVGVQSIRDVLGFVGQVAAVDPGVVEKIDADEALDAYAEMVGAPSAMIRGNEDAFKRRVANFVMNENQI